MQIKHIIYNNFGFIRLVRHYTIVSLIHYNSLTSLLIRTTDYGENFFRLLSWTTSVSPILFFWGAWYLNYEVPILVKTLHYNSFMLRLVRHYTTVSPRHFIHSMMYINTIDKCNCFSSCIRHYTSVSSILLLTCPVKKVRKRFIHQEIILRIGFYHTC